MSKVSKIKDGKRTVVGEGGRVTDMTKGELNRTASKMAEYARHRLFHIHRGSFRPGADMHVVFGNDGHATDPRSQAEAQAVKDAAEAEGCPTSDIQTDKDGATWAVAVVGNDHIGQLLESVAWETWLRESAKKVAGLESGYAQPATGEGS